MLFNYLPSCCVLCGLTTFEVHNLCIPCFNSCRVYSDSYHNACSTTFALFSYREPAISMIQKLKFKHELIYARTLGHLLTIKIRDDWYLDRRLPHLIIPVPLHAERLRERGFNQALEIGRYITRLLGVAMDYRSVSRVIPTLAQSGLSRAARQINIRGAFACHNRFNGLHIAILDDVVTTGQTVGELSRVLLNHGAGQIDVWCCARA